MVARHLPATSGVAVRLALASASTVRSDSTRRLRERGFLLLERDLCERVRGDDPEKKAKLRGSVAGHVREALDRQSGGLHDREL